MVRFIDWLCDGATWVLWMIVAVLFFGVAVGLPWYVISNFRAQGMGTGWFLIGRLGLLAFVAFISALLLCGSWVVMRTIIPHRKRYRTIP